MTTFDTNGWNLGWGWVLWYGAIFFLFFSMVGNWGYTYRVHRKINGLYSEKDAFDVLAERYARGDIKRDEYLGMKEDIANDRARISSSGEIARGNGSDPFLRQGMRSGT
jgi:putative membrane protein